MINNNNIMDSIVTRTVAIKSWRRAWYSSFVIIIAISEYHIPASGYIISGLRCYRGDAHLCNSAISTSHFSGPVRGRRNLHQTNLSMKFSEGNGSDGNEASDEDATNRQRMEIFYNILNEGTASFRFIETRTSRLLSNNPILAFAIFVVMGLFVAYMTGFFFLGGYISSPNPIENGAVPYWEE